MGPEYAIKIFGYPITVVLSAVFFFIFTALVIYFLIKEGKNYFNNQNKE